MKINNIKKTSIKYYTLLLCVGLLTFTSCDKDFGDINNAWDSNLYKAEIPGLFNQLVSSTLKTGHEHRIPVAWLYQWTQQAAMYSASGYRLEDHVTQPWENYYRNRANYYELQKLVEESDDAAKMTNVLAMAKTIMAYKAAKNALLYGDMPYTDAGKAFISTSDFRPVYESQQLVLETAINDLTDALGSLSTSADQISLGGFETLFGNDVDKWKIFANSLRLRYAMMIRDKNESFADPIIADALTKPLLAAEEAYVLDPDDIGKEINRGGFWRGNSYMRMGSTMWDAMSNTNAVDGSGIYDLRTNIFFEPNKDDEWVPYPQNPDNTTATVTGDPYQEGRTTDNWDNQAQRSNFASINVYYVNDRFIPEILIAGSEISFLKAEIYNRGIGGVAADPAMAETFYNEGITASVNYWYKVANESANWTVNKPPAAPSAAELNGMLNNIEVAYSNDAATALEQIYKQSWIAFFHQPFEAWNLQRRTGGATPGEPLAATSLVLDFNRLVYPASERETNRVNWAAVTNGGDTDKSTTKTWFQQ
ncbi:SusD/RagB family nutrient-binding outer membrane lipoprotein [Aureibaculum sp. 2210JD6-5]|uniref:SusD/RagB family nutrient-binding outer membrane lipoprotein n=1 Tax=Aureibaculum sp. 2210JD6-5 TaxID=3103957 RepID=UPI002AAD9640|nr:SusD/RagB family nutrient-binding outer membrane lipoprotein [Aureibaculum sp. 2210JD6-5]MDY7394315.1 SusD/RagB family nutrient-binding outer membrane lipoprotein [Aureibaculum sp. 2210JD6-5]